MELMEQSILAFMLLGVGAAFSLSLNREFSNLGVLAATVTIIIQFSVFYKPGL